MLSELYIITDNRTGSIAFVFDEQHRDLARATFTQAKESFAGTDEGYTLNIIASRSPHGVNGYTEQMKSMSGDVQEYEVDDDHPWMNKGLVG